MTSGQAGLCETLGDFFYSRWIIERQARHVLLERVPRIDLYEIVPDFAGFLGPAKKTVLLEETGKRLEPNAGCQLGGSRWPFASEPTVHRSFIAWAI